MGHLFREGFGQTQKKTKANTDGRKEKSNCGNKTSRDGSKKKKKGR